MKVHLAGTISHLYLHTTAQTRGIVSFVEPNEISIGPKAVRLQWPVLPDCWRSVELAEIPNREQNVEITNW